MNPIVHTMMEHLQSAGARSVEDLINHVGTGTKLEAAVWVNRTSLAVTQGPSSNDSSDGEEFILSGKWEAHVRKDKFHLGRLYDKVWGDDERPYGFFTLRIRCIRDRVVGPPHVEVTVEDPDDGPKQYALQHAEELIQGKIVEVLT